MKSVWDEMNTFQGLSIEGEAQAAWAKVVDGIVNITRGAVAAEAEQEEEVLVETVPRTGARVPREGSLDDGAADEGDSEAIAVQRMQQTEIQRLRADLAMMGAEKDAAMTVSLAMIAEKDAAMTEKDVLIGELRGDLSELKDQLGATRAKPRLSSSTEYPLSTVHPL